MLFTAFRSILVSIHAPAKGATLSGDCTPDQEDVSIHAPAKGATTQYPIIIFQSGFQSTLPRRERQDITTVTARESSFNPRSREGSDELYCNVSIAGIVSIHAPAKGATSRSWHPLVGELRVSIHAPAKGATPPHMQPLASEFQVSIHAPAKGATVLYCHVLLHLSVSIHAPAKGATNDTVYYMLPDDRFNPRSREGSDSNFS